MAKSYVLWNLQLRMPLKMSILPKVTPSFLSLIISLLACVIASLMVSLSLVSTQIHSVLLLYGKQLLRWLSWFPDIPTSCEIPSPCVYNVLVTNKWWKCWWDVIPMTRLHKTVTSAFLEDSLLSCLMKQDATLERPTWQVTEGGLCSTVRNCGPPSPRNWILPATM